jgi:hypothetical protein
VTLKKQLEVVRKIHEEKISDFEKRQQEIDALLGYLLRLQASEGNNLWSFLL